MSISRIFSIDIKNGRALLLLLAALILGVPRTWAQQPADLILHNGKILTVDKDFSVAQAVAVAGNKIIAVGPDAQVLATAGPKTQKIDLKGRTVIPGLIDTHRHMYSAAEITYGGLVSEDGLTAPASPGQDAAPAPASSGQDAAAPVIRL